MKRTIVIVDGMGGGIGVRLITKIKELPGEIIAPGTNAIATERMVKAGARRFAIYRKNIPGKLPCGFSRRSLENT